MPAASDPRPDDEAGDPEGRSGSRGRRQRRSWARRRHLGLITVAVALVALVGGVLLLVATWDSGRTPVSQQAAALDTRAPASAPPPGSTAPGTSTAPTVSSAPGPFTVRATITAVGDSRWTVASTKSALTYTVVVTPTTTFVGDRTFTSYAVDDTIVVVGTLDAGVVTAADVTGKPKG